MGYNEVPVWSSYHEQRNGHFQILHSYQDDNLSRKELHAGRSLQVVHFQQVWSLWRSEGKFISFRIRREFKNVGTFQTKRFGVWGKTSKCFWKIVSSFQGVYDQSCKKRSLRMKKSSDCSCFSKKYVYLYGVLTGGLLTLIYNSYETSYFIFLGSYVPNVRNQ